MCVSNGLESGLSSTVEVLGIKLRVLGFGDKSLYLLDYLTGP